MRRHKRSLTLLIIGLIGTIFLMMILTCAPTPSVKPQPKAPVATQPKAPVATQPKAEEMPPYAIKLKPLSAAECGRCHLPVYNQIKNEGGKHQIECVTCHTKYHVYSPVKKNWKEIMPQCKACHGLFHGKKHTSCSVCHKEPHAPKKQIPVSAELSKACVDCHGSELKEAQKYQSKHTKVQCSACHREKHGYSPSCSECHTPHAAVKDCLACHPAHSPLRVSYSETVSNKVCGSCHGKVYKKLEASASKHRQVACSTCHYSRHRYIPRCEECHGKPHGEGLFKKFPNCLDCHIDVHSLPSKAGG